MPKKPFAIACHALALSVLAIPSACGPTLQSCDGTQEDYDAAFEACAADAQEDVCSGAEKGTSYDRASHDICDDQINDQAGEGCEAGYAESYDRGCDDPDGA